MAASDRLYLGDGWLQWNFRRSPWSAELPGWRETLALGLTDSKYVLSLSYDTCIGEPPYDC